MRNPLASFEARPPPMRRDSSSTVASSVAEEQVNHHDKMAQMQTNRTASSPMQNNFLTRTQVNVVNSKGINIGGTTNVYNNCFSKDCKNPAFVLNNENVTLREKFLYVLSTRWCWGLLFLALLLCTLSNMMFFFVLTPEPQIVLVSRYGWGAEPSIEELEALRLPTRRIIMSHTEDEQETCKNRAECIRRVRALQQSYIAQGLDDIPWNFLVGGDGAIYEGRGFKLQGEIPTKSVSSFTEFGYHIAFIGDFSLIQPGPDLVYTFENFLNNAVQREVLSGDYRIFLEDQLTLDEAVYGLYLVLRDNLKFYEMQRIWSRSLWNADPPKNPSIMERLPVDVETVNARRMTVPFDCADLDECYTVVKNQQDYDFTNSLNDIRYNFLIGDEGIFEGRGWDIQPETPPSERDSLSIGFFANYLYQPGQFLNNTLIDLMRDGKEIGKLSETVQIRCEYQLCTLI